MSSGKIRRNRRKKRKGAWRVKGHVAAINATAMMQHLADETGTTPQGAAEALQRLEAAGMIRREEDGRVILLLTGNGEP